MIGIENVNDKNRMTNPATEEKQIEIIETLLSHTNITSGYIFSNLEEVSPISYIGYENQEGEWVIKKLDETAGMIMKYATGTTDYATNWTNRASLTYSSPSVTF